MATNVNDNLEIKLPNFEIPNTSNGFADVVGLDRVKEQLKVLFIWPKKFPELFTKRQYSRKMLLFGPTGSGKTLLVNAVAKEVEAKIFFLRCSEITTFYKESGRKLASFFEKLNKAETATILHLDDIDLLSVNVQDRKNDVYFRFRSDLKHELSCMPDNKNLHVIATTNRPWDVELSLLRLFTKRIYVGTPTKVERKIIISDSVAKYFTEDMSPYWYLVLLKTEGYTVWDLKMLFERTLIKPVIEMASVEIWIKENEKYRPFQPAADKIIVDMKYCSLEKMLPGTVQARELKLTDLLLALSEGIKSVSKEEMMKFYNFLKFHESLHE